MVRSIGKGSVEKRVSKSIFTHLPCVYMSRYAGAPPASLTTSPIAPALVMAEPARSRAALSLSPVAATSPPSSSSPGAAYAPFLPSPHVVLFPAPPPPRQTPGTPATAPGRSRRRPPPPPRRS